MALMPHHQIVLLPWTSSEVLGGMGKIGEYGASGGGEGRSGPREGVGLVAALIIASPTLCIGLQAQHALLQSPHLQNERQRLE